MPRRGSGAVSHDVGTASPTTSSCGAPSSAERPLDDMCARMMKLVLPVSIFIPEENSSEYSSSGEMITRHFCLFISCVILAFGS